MFNFKIVYLTRSHPLHKTKEILKIKQKGIVLLLVKCLHFLGHLLLYTGVDSELTQIIEMMIQDKVQKLQKNYQ